MKAHEQKHYRWPGAEVKTPGEVRIAHTEDRRQRFTIIAEGETGLRPPPSGYANAIEKAVAEKSRIPRNPLRLHYLRWVALSIMIHGSCT